jgi:biopolymer transport protein ExbD
MKLAKAEAPSCEPDMTPMIDVTFQLIIFFMLTMNFSQDEQNELIRLPSSELAKPADAKAELPLTIQVSNYEEGNEKKGIGRGRIFLLGGAWCDIAGLDRPLLAEAQMIKDKGGTPAKATVIIRADREAPTGKVQELIKVCQKRGFEKFVLRAKQELSGY